MPKKRYISVGARSSLLSRMQFKEVERELQTFYPHIVFVPFYLKTRGDYDKKTSLRGLEKTDFFTREIDEKQLAGEFSLAIHSAKYLPDPLAAGLSLVALTKGVDASDSLVLPQGKSLEDLPPKALIATSSQRREESVRALREDVVFTEVRGTIEERLKQLNRGHVEGIVIAEAALIRLGLTQLNRIPLPGTVAPGQGRLAVVARQEDHEMKKIFQCLHVSDIHHHSSE